MPPGDQCLQEVLMCSRQKNAFNTAGNWAAGLIEPSSSSTASPVGYFVVKGVG